MTRKPAGSKAVLRDPVFPRLTIVADVSENYEFILVVNDGKTGSYPETIVITASVDENNPPIADAGPDQSVETGTKVTLDEIASSAPDGDPIMYDWKIVTAPGCSTRRLLAGVPKQYPNWFRLLILISCSSN